MSQILTNLQQMEQRSIDEGHQFRQAFLTVGHNINQIQNSLQEHGNIIQLLCQNTTTQYGQPLISQDQLNKINPTSSSPNHRLLQTSQSISTLTDSSHSVVDLSAEIDKEKTTNLSTRELDQEDMTVEMNTAPYGETQSQNPAPDPSNLNSEQEPHQNQNTQDVQMSLSEENQRSPREDGHRETDPPGGGQNP